MFAARGFAVSSSTFFILYSVLSLVVCLVWRRVWVRGHQGSARRCADLLFFLRMLPLVAAMGAAMNAPAAVAWFSRLLTTPGAGTNR